MDDLKKETDVLDGTQRELMEQPILEGKYQNKVSGDKAITNLSGENRIVLEGEELYVVYNLNYLLMIWLKLYVP